MRRELALTGLVLALVLVTRATLPVFDDALFFRRFALHLLDHGVYAWNVADGPVHGNTSQLWQGVVTGLAALARGHTVALGRLVLAGCVLGAAALWLRRRPRAPAVVVLALLSPLALPTVVSGMETATTLLLGAALLTLPRAGGVLGVALYLARPDTVLLSVPTLLLRRQWGQLVVLVLGVGAALALFSWGYGSALPLSAALKAGPASPYGAHFLALSDAAGRRHLLMAALVAAPLLLWAEDRRWWLPAGLFVAFHALVSVDVMGMHARFYVPALPWLVHAARDGRPRLDAGLAVWGLAVWGMGLWAAVSAGAVPGDGGWEIGRVSPWTWGAFAIAAAGAGVVGARSAPAWVAVVLGAGVVASRPSLPDRVLDDRAVARRLARSVTSWRGMKEARACLGPGAHMAHSEIGVPGVFFDRVTDLSGLMDPARLDPAWDIDAWCQQAQPALLFLPHRNYREMNTALAEGGCLDGYVRVVEKGSSPMHVRRDVFEAEGCGFEAVE